MREPERHSAGWWRRDPTVVGWAGVLKIDLAEPEVKIAATVLVLLRRPDLREHTELILNFGRLVLQAAQNPGFTGSDNTLVQAGVWEDFRDALKAMRQFVEMAGAVCDATLLETDGDSS